MGKKYPWPRPPGCPRCRSPRLWGHGYVGRYFDDFAQPLCLRRYRCPDCGAVHTLRPHLYGRRFQAIWFTIFLSLLRKITLGQWLHSILVSEISRLGKYEVYSQENVRTLAGWTAERMQLGCTDTKCLTALGQMDIAKLISGRVGKIGNRYSVSLNLFDTQNARAEKSVSEFGRSEDELIDLVQAALGKLLGVEVSPPSGGQRPSPSSGSEIGRDGRFIAYSNGTVLDTRTNLMWAAKDNGSNINWGNAKSYCENYRGGGYTDWRMPTQDELAGLYDSSKSYQATQRYYFVHLTELIQLSACCPWASETRGSDAAAFVFGNGGRLWYRRSDDVTGRALPVRSGK